MTIQAVELSVLIDIAGPVIAQIATFNGAIYSSPVSVEDARAVARTNVPSIPILSGNNRTHCHYANHDTSCEEQATIAVQDNPPCRA